MFGGGRVKLDKDLIAKVKKYANIAGYSSVEEFITHALEKELAVLEEADSEDDIPQEASGPGLHFLAPQSRPSLRLTHPNGIHGI